MNSSMENNEACHSCEFEENLAILREIYFFSELPLEALKLIAYLCTRENFKEGDFLFHQKDDDGQAIYVISGRARLTHASEEDSIIVRDIDKDAFFGSLALLGNARRLFSLQAVTEMTCLILAREKFAKVMEQFPDIMPRILQAVAGSVHSWEKKFMKKSLGGCKACRQRIGVSLV